MSDPYHMLGVSHTPTDEDVRQAYLQAIKQCSPEQDAQRFQSIQQAYELIKTQRLRLKYKWFDYQPLTPVDLLAQISKQEKNPKVCRPSIELFQALLYSKK